MILQNMACRCAVNAATVGSLSKAPSCCNDRLQVHISVPVDKGLSKVNSAALKLAQLPTELNSIGVGWRLEAQPCSCKMQGSDSDPTSHGPNLGPLLFHIPASPSSSHLALNFNSTHSTFFPSFYSRLEGVGSSGSSSLLLQIRWLCWLGLVTA
jgi:hypothetical protein